jgi:hypothetical protein
MMTSFKGGPTLTTCPRQSGQKAQAKSMPRVGPIWLRFLNVTAYALGQSDKKDDGLNKE